MPFEDPYEIGIHKDEKVKKLHTILEKKHDRTWDNYALFFNDTKLEPLDLISQHGIDHKNNVLEIRMKVCYLFVVPKTVFFLYCLDWCECISS